MIRVEVLRQGLIPLRNELQAARSHAGRLKSGGKNARNLRRYAEEKVADLRAREQASSDQLKSFVRTRAYRNGVDRLLMICTESEEVEAYCLGKRW